MTEQPNETPRPNRTSRSAPSPEVARVGFFLHLRRHLRALYRFVRHELNYRENAGDLVPGELTAEDVVDAVVLRAYGAYVGNPKRRRSPAWLIRLASDHIESEAARLQALREDMKHLEEDIPETPPEEEVTTLGEEILYFYQPDEDLKLEDVVPDLEAASPEDRVEARELRGAVAVALEEMPATWRRALLLRHAEGLRPSELAEALGLSSSEVERILEQARARVRQRVAEAGYRFGAVPV